MYSVREKINLEGKKNKSRGGLVKYEYKSKCFDYKY